MNFRYDINGLRAIAVIAVVLFHFNPNWVPGGFAGVDVFFVISGFLMTSIIFRGLENDDFNLFKFYVARANRIIPALAVLCLVLLVFGWFYLTPMDYRALGKHATSSMGFLSNVIYWRESGYFDAASHEKWLLHTWSLSVEWQFYIIYPVILMALKKFLSITNIKRLLVVGTLLGFAFSVIATMKWPNPAYYLLPTRAWEMMFGGLAFLYPIDLSNNKKKVAEWTGLVLILLSYTFISSDIAWPGHWALVPVLGAYLIIIANRQNSIVTNNPVFQTLGKWSYSIYLWHWPIVVFGTYYSLPTFFNPIGLIGSCLLGYISFRYIESLTFRSFNSWLDIWKAVPVWAVIILIGSYSIIFINHGFNSRLSIPDDIEVNKLNIAYRGNGYCFYSHHESDWSVSIDKGTECYLGTQKGSSSSLIFGDSYAGHNEPFWDKIYDTQGLSLHSVVTNWCVPSFTSNFTGPKSDSVYDQCLLNREYLHANYRKYKNVILAGSWAAAYRRGQLIDTVSMIQEMAKSNVNLFIMAAPKSYKKSPLSIWKSNILRYISQLELNYNVEYDKPVIQANNILKAEAEKYPNVYFLTRKELYADSDTFTLKGSTIAIPYSYDGGHISILGSENSAEYFMKQESYSEIMSILFNIRK